MKSFVVEPNMIREFGSKNTTIRLGNAFQKNIYFAVLYHDYNDTWEITAVPKSFHSEMLPLGERQHAPTDQV